MAATAVEKRAGVARVAVATGAEVTVAVTKEVAARVAVMVDGWVVEVRAAGGMVEVARAEAGSLAVGTKPRHYCARARR